MAALGDIWRQQADDKPALRAEDMAFESLSYFKNGMHYIQTARPGTRPEFTEGYDAAFNAFQGIGLQLETPLRAGVSQSNGYRQQEEKRKSEAAEGGRSH